MSVSASMSAFRDTHVAVVGALVRDFAKDRIMSLSWVVMNFSDMGRHSGQILYIIPRLDHFGVLWDRYKEVVSII